MHNHDTEVNDQAIEQTDAAPCDRGTNIPPRII